jgi:hypothetical protein
MTELRASPVLYWSSASAALIGRPFPQNGFQQRLVNGYLAVVVDQAKLTKLVHETTDAGSGGADHFC